MNPRIGTTVYYWPTKEEKVQFIQAGCNNNEVLPATVVSIQGEGIVNLKVHLDGPSADHWATSRHHGTKPSNWDFQEDNGLAAKTPHSEEEKPDAENTSDEEVEDEKAGSGE